MRRLIASWFGSGLILRHFRGSDGGSGTLAALFTYPVVLFLARHGWIAQMSTALGVAILSIWASQRFSTQGDSHADPGWVVVDEAAGTLVSTIGLCGIPAVAAIAVFRVADIFKTRFPGVSASERLPGGFGITADDVVAGLYGLAVGWTLTAWL